MKKLSLATLCIVLVAVSFWAGGRYGAKPSAESDTQPQREILYYVDPMTPGFRSDSPGTAPCGMPLEPVYADAEGGAQNLPPGAVKVNPGKQQLIGVKLATVNQKPITHSLRLYGQVVPDETLVYRINSAVESWVRELSDVTTGSYVKKNQILAETLSPKYYNAQVSYLLALNNMDRMREQLGGELRHQQGEIANNQIRNAVQNLQNLGITDAQIEKLARTRKAQPYLEIRSPTTGFVLNRNISLNQWFRAGEEFYSIVDLGKVWVYADVYENEAKHLPPGTPVKVKHAHLGKTFDAQVSEVLPLFDPISKTLKVRVDIDNPDFELRPDMFVDVEIPITLPPSLYVSADAIINTGTKEILYVDIGDGVLEPRQVDTGQRLGRWVEIAGGLMPGETIVASGNFLIDSESRMKTAGAAPEAMVAKDLVCGMMVNRQDATEAGRILVLGDKTYYFCAAGCMVSFHDNPEKYLGNDATGDEAHAIHSMAGQGDDKVRAKDPVCGMQVNADLAEQAEMAVTLGGRTYHFCSRECMHQFDSNHKKYAIQSSPEGETDSQKSKPKAKHSQHEAKKPKTAQKKTQSKATQSATAKKDFDIKPYLEGEADWDKSYNKTNDAPMNWPGGWGKFPGARYLGMGEDPNKDPSKKQKTVNKDNPDHTSQQMKPATAPNHDHAMDNKGKQAGAEAPSEK